MLKNADILYTPTKAVLATARLGKASQAGTDPPPNTGAIAMTEKDKLEPVIHLHGMRQYKVPGRKCYTTFWRWLPYTIKCHVMGFIRRRQIVAGGPSA